MAYSAEVVKRARARLAQAKEDRESENRQHLAEAYARVPRIKEIDLELRRTMARAAQAAFQRGSDGRELLEQARRNNLELQQERAILAMEHFEPGYLDESPICDSCGGSGYIGSAMCECLQELCRQEQKKEVSILSGSKDTFNQFRLDYYPDQVDRNLGVNIRSVMEKTFQTCRRYALTFTDAREQSYQKHLLIFVSLDAFEKIGNLMFVQRLDFLLRHPWKNARVRGIGTYVIVQHGLLKCLMKNTMDILDGLG